MHIEELAVNSNLENEDDLRVVLSYQSGLPIYEQIKDQIKASILSGELVEDELLPSIRQLARELKVSVITTTRAYNDLELEGYISTVQGKGCYVKSIDEDFIRSQYLDQTKIALATAIQLGHLAGLSIDNMQSLLVELEGDADEQCD